MTGQDKSTSGASIGRQNERRIAILGAGGQIGRALISTLGDRAIPLLRADLDLTDLPSAAATLDRIRPSAIINAAGYTNVDRAERESELAMQINGEAPGFLSRWSKEHDLPFIHFSTDYVFSGYGSRPWREADAPAPINAYGRSKLDGERQVMAADGHSLIFRTSWVYDNQGRNFLTTILRLAQERQTLNIVDDQWGAPTYATHLAAATVAALERARAGASFPAGIYHACNSGTTTWYRFARALLGLARLRGESLTLTRVVRIRTEQYPTPAHRPLNSRLDTCRLGTTLGVTLPPWQMGLEQCMQVHAGAVAGLQAEEG